MNIDAVDFASLLCSRLCHDLLSPVAALSNGLELLAQETEPDMRQQCLDLLAESCRATVNKLKFFRLAFGAAGGFGELVDSSEVREAIEGLFAANSRLTLGWMVSEPRLSKPAMKVLLNLALIGGDALIRGGRLDIGVERRAGVIEIVIRATGDRLVLDSAIRESLLGNPPQDALIARLGPALLARAIAAQHHGHIQLAETASSHLLLGAVLRD
ncbi:MAG: histidine phosphotransferase family protein [Sphingomonadaceae bacterium]|jgi:histidine phosphotransferase ChpT